MKLRYKFISLATCVLSFVWSAIVDGQNEPPPPATPPAAANPKSDDPLREQTIYIPYSKLRETFEKEGRGVYLPYDQFQELWKKARQADQPAIDKRPPAGVLITDIESEATVERDVMVVRAKLKLEVLGEGWQEASLRLTDAAIRSAKIGDEPARIVWNQEKGYTLLVKNDGKEPKKLELALEYAKGFSKSPGLNTVSFAAPQAPINRWRIRIPQKGVKVQIQPLIAATEEPAAAPAAATPPTPATPPANPPVEETVLLAFVGAAPEVKIDWTPKSEGATGLEALATAQAQQEVTLEEGVLRTRIRLTYEISRAELSQLQVTLPANQKVTGVFDPNVRQWDVTAMGDEQTLVIQLFEPAKKTQNVTIELERFSDQLLTGDVPVPVVKAVGVGRQQGIVVVRIGEELRAEPSKRSGLLQVDAAELPPPLQGQPWSFAYRYSALPFELSLRVEKVNPRIRSDELVEIYLQPESTTINLLALYDIQQAGVFQLELDVPAGYDVRQVRGQAAAGAEAAAVDSHALSGDAKTRLKVNLARKAIGRVGLFVELSKQLNDPNLLTPTGQTSKVELPMPRTATTVEGTNGRLVVFAPESLRINPDQLTGLRSVSVAEAMQGIESQRAGRFPLTREVLAFVYTQEPATLSVTAERRKPQVSARQLLTARIEAGVVKYDATFHFDVQYSSVKSLRIDVPAPLASEIRNVTQGIREKTIDPRPADAAEGFTPWSFTGDSEFLGAVTIRLTWESKSKELEVGQSIDFPMPILKPMGIDRAWGQIVVAKAETLDVNAKAGFSGLRPIDPQRDLMDGAQIADAARAFEFHDAWSLTITATRYELEDVKRTSIERAVIRMVVTRSKQISVQALYRVRSAVQRLAVKLPEGAQLDSDSLRLNGRAVPLERGDKDEMYIPLVNQNPDEAFIIELRYTVPGDHQRLDFPVFPAQPPIQSEPAMQKVHLLVYLPEEMALLASDGPWNNEAAYWYERLNGLPVAQDARQRIDWVTEGIALQTNPTDSFPTDGRMYEFTTLRPVPPPDGSLRLVAWNQRWLNFALFGGLAVIGLVFLRQPLSRKLGAVAVIVTAIVLVGVFAPTLSLQLLDPVLLIALALVVFLWLVAAARMWQPAATVPPMPPPPVSSAAVAATNPPPQDSIVTGEPLDTNKTVDSDTASPFKPEDKDQGGKSNE
jgi:hypothetical protein